MPEWETMRRDAEEIFREAVSACMPEKAVRRALSGRYFTKPVILAAVGKAAWTMAKAAWEILGEEKISRGMVITKTGHSRGPIGTLEIREATHPVLGREAVDAASRLLHMTKGLTAEDTVILLVSGGGSALFESPLIPLEELADVNRQLLACGASIEEINTIRKRLSGVKGGRFAEACAPAKVLAVLLSDVLGNQPDVIASGPACPDRSTCAEALEIVSRYQLKLSEKALDCLKMETPKSLENAEVLLSGSVSELCRAAGESAAKRGYRPVLLTDCLSCQAKEAGSFLASVAKTQIAQNCPPIAVIAGGETVVKLTGKGLGGRCQELALAAAEGLFGLPALLLAAGSDGTDGPTDAAGGFADGRTAGLLGEKNLRVPEVLEENDAYHALDSLGNLLRTGPTGTNVNDLYLLLLRP